MENWRVDRDLITSDHNAILFDLRVGRPLKPLKPISTRRYNTKKARWADFTTTMKSGLVKQKVTLSSVSDVSSNEELEEMLTRVIRKTSRRQDDTLLRNAAGETLTPDQSAELLAKTFYPNDSVTTDTAYHKQVREAVECRIPAELQDLSEDDPPFTTSELEMVLSSQNPKKAPGPDGLTSDICTAAINYDREVFLALANKCLSLSYFPKQWKVAHVCILRKPAKEDYTHPKSYRPTGLLSIFGKTVEKLLVDFSGDSSQRCTMVSMVSCQKGERRTLSTSSIPGGRLN
ncbi:unnamed protein product [Euphydryas editha]|uniref:Retrovirus-related Pol polyprotein from type-1 retrotransposable element R1 n=1 Tax=Euphydryas editha TaxID=104508 RepID=A0AAU9UQI8_EUPED|nr:unnamed protein product [Euphydryas editha]